MQCFQLREQTPSTNELIILVILVATSQTNPLVGLVSGGIIYGREIGLLEVLGPAFGHFQEQSNFTHVKFSGQIDNHVAVTELFFCVLANGIS
jgi:hypothetical protein